MPGVPGTVHLTNRVQDSPRQPVVIHEPGFARLLVSVEHTCRPRVESEYEGTEPVGELLGQAGETVGDEYQKPFTLGHRVRSVIRGPRRPGPDGCRSSPRGPENPGSRSSVTSTGSTTWMSPVTLTDRFDRLSHGPDAPKPKRENRDSWPVGKVRSASARRRARHGSES